MKFVRYNMKYIIYYIVFLECPNLCSTNMYMFNRNNIYHDHHLSLTH